MLVSARPHKHQDIESKGTGVFGNTHPPKAVASRRFLTPISFTLQSCMHLNAFSTRDALVLSQVFDLHLAAKLNGIPRSSFGLRHCYQEPKLFDLHLEDVDGHQPALNGKACVNQPAYIGAVAGCRERNMPQRHRSAWIDGAHFN